MSTKPSTHHHTHHTPYTCQILIRTIGLFLLFCIIVVLSFAWLTQALTVDFNGIAYSIEMKGAYAPGGDSGDNLHFERIEMKKDGGFIAIAASMTLFQRIATTTLFIVLSYTLAVFFLKECNEYKETKAEAKAKAKAKHNKKTE